MKLSTILIVLIAFATAGLAPAPSSAQPCETGAPIVINAGVADDFAAPAEPSVPGAALAAAFPTLQWKGFDDPAVNQYVGHTFIGLPAGIQRAELELRLEPLNDNPDNDIVGMGLLPGPSFSRTFHIAGLKDAQGTWSFQRNGPTKFTISLGAAEADLLAQMSTQHVLDVLVGDDTAVDSMKLSVWSCPPPVMDHGLFHSGLGPAQISQVTSGTVVFNPGGDPGGVGIFTGGFPGLYLNLLQPVCLGLGTAMQLEAQGELSGTPTSVKLRFTSSPVTGLIDITAEFPPPYDLACVELFKGAAVVFNSHCESQKTVVASLPPDTCIREVDWTVFNLTSGFSILMEPGANVTLPTQGVHFADRIIIRPDLGLSDGIKGFRLSSFNLQTTGVPTFTIGAEKAQSFELSHSALGNATFEGSDSGLTLATPGAGDGVAIDLVQSKSASLAFAPFDPLGLAPDGASLQADLTGSLNGQPGKALGTVKAIRQTSGGTHQLEVTPDFSALGAPTHRVEVYDHGVQVASVSGHSGPAAINVIVIWPASLAIPEGGGFSLTWPASGLVSVSGGPTVTGNELRFVPEPSSFVMVDNVSGLALRVAGLPAITLTDEQTTQCLPPVILSQPANVSTAAGRPAVFTVAANGDGPLTYRWRHNSLALADGNRYSGTATAVLTLPSTVLAQAGTYDVTVSNACGSVVSAPATYAPGSALRSLLLALLGKVQSLAGTGGLSAQQAAGLSAPLLHALTFLHAGELASAASRMDIFIARVNAFVHAAALSPSQGKALTDAAAVVRTDLAP
jgi:hypothetical protein